ncbi:hypothetical protein GW17_00031733 [Ensete ventricosum]|nr:hypothetical protein GW17_00031733 [Ensete ventricosum]
MVCFTSLYWYTDQLLNNQVNQASSLNPIDQGINDQDPHPVFIFCLFYQAYHLLGYNLLKCRGPGANDQRENSW